VKRALLSVRKKRQAKILQASPRPRLIPSGNYRFRPAAVLGFASRNFRDAVFPDITERWEMAGVALKRKIGLRGYSGAAAMASISTTNSGRAKPDTIINVVVGGVPGNCRSRDRL
jgi:hypothetical protein